MHNIWELRLHALAYFFCIEQPGLFPQLSSAHAEFWHDMHACATRGLTNKDWEDPDLGDIDSRRILTDEEFNVWIARLHALKVEEGEGIE